MLKAKLTIGKQQCGRTCIVISVFSQGYDRTVRPRCAVLHRGESRRHDGAARYQEKYPSLLRRENPRTERAMSRPRRLTTEVVLADRGVDEIEREGAVVHVDEFAVLDVFRVVNARRADVADVALVELHWRSIGDE